MHYVKACDLDLYLFHKKKALKKLWKMLFILLKKVFLVKVFLFSKN